MKKVACLSLLSVMSLFMISSAFAQRKKTDPEHIIVYKNSSIQTGEVKIELTDAVSEITFSKFKLKLTNNTADYIIYNPKESLLLIDGKEFAPSDRLLLLTPNGDKASRVIDVKGNGTNVHVDAYTFKLNGLSRIDANAPSTPAPNFKLPASVNEFTAGNFKVQLTKLDKETDETVAKFKVTYIGKDYGLVNPNNIGVKIDNGSEFASTKNEQKVALLAFGESENFVAVFKIPGKVADMQFANMEILWRDTFKDAKSTKLEGVTVDLQIDEAKTLEKNK